MTEGLALFWKYHYVKGIFALSCLFMVEVTILDYSMKVLAQAKVDEEHPGDPHASPDAHHMPTHHRGWRSFAGGSTRIIYISALVTEGIFRAQITSR